MKKTLILSALILGASSLSAFEGAFEEIYFRNGPDGYEAASISKETKSTQAPVKIEKVDDYKHSLKKYKENVNGTTMLPSTTYSKKQKFLANTLFVIVTAACMYLLLNKKQMANKTA